jgi:hypothetical protein
VSEKIAVQSLYTVTDEELMLMSSQNPELRFERTSPEMLDLSSAMPTTE